MTSPIWRSPARCTGRLPLPPANLLGDFGGGAISGGGGDALAALIHARATGQGQVVDAAIMRRGRASGGDGMAGQGAWTDRRMAAALDGAAPWYTTYACACGVVAGAIEPALGRAGGAGA